MLHALKMTSDQSAEIELLLLTALKLLKGRKLKRAISLTSKEIAVSIRYQTAPKFISMRELYVAYCASIGPEKPSMDIFSKRLFLEHPELRTFRSQRRVKGLTRRGLIGVDLLFIS